MTATPDIGELCKRARRLLRSKDYDAALELLQKALTLDESSVDVHESLGTAYFLTGDLESAVTHFTRVTKLDPRRGAAYINLGAVYNRLENYPKAIEALRKGVQFDKRSAEGYYNLGIAYRRQKQLAMAIPAYREAIRLEPEMAEAYMNLGNVYLEMGNLQQALMQFQKALEINPQFARAEQGLKAVRAAQASAKVTANPFGRLVQQSGVLDQETNTTANEVSQRELGEEERAYDRKTLAMLLYDIRSHSQQLLEHLERKIEPGMKELDRALVSETAVPGTVDQTWRRIQPAINIFRVLRRGLKVSVDELRQHERRVAEGRLP